MTEPLRSILDRDVERFISANLSKETWLVRDVVNYGTNLIVRCFEESKKSGGSVTDVVLLPVLLKHAVAMLDGFEIHLTHGALLPARLSARALFEASCYTQWILAADTDNRAKHHYVWHLREQRRWANRVLPGTKENNDFAAVLKDLPTFSGTSQEAQNAVAKLQAEAQKQVAQIDKLLGSSTYQSINDAFDQKKYKYWFGPCGPSHIAQLAEDVGSASEYKVFYHHYCQTSHATEFRSHIIVGDERVDFEPIRGVSDYQQLIQAALSFTWDLYRKILERYRPGELDQFNRKYREDWREAFLGMTKVEVCPVFQSPP